jgi:hypothetical protein
MRAGDGADGVGGVGNCRAVLGGADEGGVERYRCSGRITGPMRSTVLRDVVDDLWAGIDSALCEGALVTKSNVSIAFTRKCLMAEAP